MSPRQGPRILVLDEATVADRKGLEMIRALARAGFRVSIAGSSFRGGAFYSRYLQNRHSIPAAEPGSAVLAQAIADLVIRHDFATLLPASDHATLALAHAAANLPAELNLSVPGPEAAETAKSKPRTLELAREIGIATPRTWLPDEASELEALADQLPYPCFVKPRRGAGSWGQWTVRNRDELLAVWGRRPGPDTAVFNFSKPLVQEHIEGPVHEVCCLFKRGEPRALLTQKRLLMQPAEGGPGIYNETTDEADLKEIAVQLLRRLRWHGPAQVEFIRETASGKPWLLEINGRYWGTLGLSVAAGMNFPVLAARMALEGDIEPQQLYRVGLRHRWIVPHAFRFAVESGRWGPAFRHFALPAPGVRSDLDWRDPLPLVMEFCYAFTRMIRGPQKFP